MVANQEAVRITGPIASEEYVIKYGRSTDVDRWIAMDLRDGYLEFDPVSEKIYMTSLGRLFLYEAGYAMCH